VDGKEVVAHTEAIFDTGTTQLVGDRHTISKFFENIPGSKPAPELDDGAYTSALRDAVTWLTLTHILISLLCQSHVISTVPFSSMLVGRISILPLLHLISVSPSPMTIVHASLARRG
jgi:hypothetical protein